MLKSSLSSNNISSINFENNYNFVVLAHLFCSIFVFIFVETKEIKDIIAEEKNTTIVEEETSSQDKDEMVVQENVSESNISVPKEKPAQKIAIIENKKYKSKLL